MFYSAFPLRSAKRETAREVGGRFVMSHQWDAEDSRLLVCEAKSVKPPPSQGLLANAADKEERVKRGLTGEILEFRYAMSAYRGISHFL